jgi:hypothetical protein
MRKRQLTVGLMLLFFGAVALLNGIGKPGIRAVDVVRFVGSGACFGVAVVALLGRLKLRDE